MKSALRGSIVRRWAGKIPVMTAGTRLMTAMLAAALGAAGCERAEPPRASAQVAPAGGSEPTVYTTFYPTEYFAARIGGGKVRVVCPIPPDEDPIFWTPSAEIIREYQGAGLIVLNGAGFEKWVDSASLPESRTVQSARSLDGGLLRIEAVTHSHGPAGSHTHEGFDGHTWVDPVNAAAQAGEIRDAMAARFPEHAAEFERNAAALARDLALIDTRFKDVSSRIGSAVLLASHPAYNYSARRYGWKIHNLHLDPDTAPSEHDLHDIEHALERAVDGSPRLLLWESEPLSATREVLVGRFGLQSVVFSPCETLASKERGAGKDYLKVMHENLDRLETALTQSSP